MTVLDRGAGADRHGCAAVTHADLVALSGRDPWVRLTLPDPLQGEAVIVDGVAVVQRLGHRRGLWVAPLRSGMPSGRVEPALRAVVELGLVQRWDVTSASVPQEHAALAHALLPLTDAGGDWDWMWTTSEPRVSGAVRALETRLEPLDDAADAEELRAFAAEHNPRVWARIGEGEIVRWLGARDADGRLLAVGGAEREATGVPHLTGILTATHARGQGWGEAVSAALTRWALREPGACTLGMFSDNDVARRLYHRLGYRTARAWHSRSLARA